MKSVIIGGANTPMLKNSGKSAIGLYSEAIKLALDYYKITLDQIDGIITGGSFIEPQFMFTNALTEQLGLKLRWAGSVDNGGDNAISALILADAMIRANKASMVLVTDADNVGTFYKNHPKEFFQKACESMSSQEERFSNVNKPIVAYMYNEITEWYAQEFIAKHGDKSKNVLRESLMEIAIVMSKHASKNPLAINQKVLTREDIMNSSKIAEWLYAYECARPADGGGAIIMASSEIAKNLNIDNPIFILGSGQSFDHKNKINCISPWGCKKAGKEAFVEAKITAKELNTAFLYDCFPITIIKALEDLNFCNELEAPYYILDGNLELGKSPCPINTHGGLLSGGAPWAAASIFGLVEIIKQLQGQADDRQIPNTQLALAYGNGGCFSSSSVVILTNRGNKT